MNGPNFSYFYLLMHIYWRVDSEAKSLWSTMSTCTHRLMVLFCNLCFKAPCFTKSFILRYRYKVFQHQSHHQCQSPYTNFLRVHASPTCLLSRYLFKFFLLKFESHILTVFNCYLDIKFCPYLISWMYLNILDYYNFLFYIFFYFFAPFNLLTIIIYCYKKDTTRFFFFLFGEGD